MKFFNSDVESNRRSGVILVVDMLIKKKDRTVKMLLLTEIIKILGMDFVR